MFRTYLSKCRDRVNSLSYTDIGQLILIITAVSELKTLDMKPEWMLLENLVMIENSEKVHRTSDPWQATTGAVQAESHSPKGIWSWKKTYTYLMYFQFRWLYGAVLYAPWPCLCLTSTVGSLTFLDLFYSKSFIIGFLFYVGTQNKTYQKTSQKLKRMTHLSEVMSKGGFTLAHIWHFTVTFGTYNSLPHVHTACPDSTETFQCRFTVSLSYKEKPRI